MKKYIYLIITTLLSLILGVFYIDSLISINQSINSISTFVIVILLVILGVLITVFLYDVGHLIFTKLAGYKIVSFKILNTEFYYIDGKIKISHHPIKDHQSKIVIASENENNHYVFYYLGGVFTNLIVAAFCTILVMITNNSGTFFLLLVMFGLANTLCALLSVLPISFFYSDGFYYYSLVKDPIAIQAFHHKNSLVALILKGKNLDEVNFSMYKIDNLNNDYDDPIILELKELETYYYLYRLQFREALETIDYVFERSNHMLKIYQKAFTNLKIICLTLNHLNDDALNLYLSISKNHKKYIAKCKTIDDALAALAMHLKIEIDKEKAENAYDKCNEFSKNTPYLGERQPIKDLIDYMINDEKDAN